MRTRPRSNDRSIRILSGFDAHLLKHPDVVAAQRDDEIGGEMVVVDLRGAVRGGVAVFAQHVAGPAVGGGARMPVAGSGARHPHRSDRPRSLI